MGIPAIRLTEKTRKRLGLVSAVANFFCVVPSLVLFGLGGYMQVSVQDKVDLIRDYNGHYLPPMIICLGFIYLVINLAGGKICLDNTKHRKRKKVRVVFAAYIYVSTIMCLLVILTSIFCFTQIGNLHHAFHNGISSAMMKYRLSARMKETIDKLQIEFRCCGNNGYRDWFNTPWINEQYLAQDSEAVQSRMLSGHYVSDDTPFSCCDVDAIRPCIHHRVLATKRHYNYNSFEELTLYRTGCKQALVEVYGGQLLTNVGIMILIISLLQIGVVVCARFLQTSILSTIKHGKPKGSAKGWLFPWPRRHHGRRKTTEIETAEGEDDQEEDSIGESEGGDQSDEGGFVLEDQSYSTHGLSGPAVPPLLPPSFGAAINESNNISDTNFSNRRRFPIPPPLPTPPTPITPPRLPPPPSGYFPSVSPIRRPGTRWSSSQQRLPFSSQSLLNRRSENIPVRRQNSRTVTPNIPIFQNGFYRNDNIQ